MTDGYVLDMHGSKLLSGLNELVAELKLPRGRYLVWAKADVVATGVIKVDPVGEARLVVGAHEDQAVSYLRAEGAGGNRETIALNLGGDVTIPDGGAQLFLSTTIPKGIRVERVKLSAIRLDTLAAATAPGDPGTQE